MRVPFLNKISLRFLEQWFLFCGFICKNSHQVSIKFLKLQIQCYHKKFLVRFILLLDPPNVVRAVFVKIALIVKYTPQLHIGTILVELYLELLSFSQAFEALEPRAMESALKRQKLKHNFRDTINPMCLTNDCIGDTEHFLLLFPSFDVKRQDLLAGIVALLRPFAQITKFSNDAF